MSSDTPEPDAGPAASAAADSSGDGQGSPFRWLAVAVVLAVLASSAVLRSASVVDPRFVLAGLGLTLPLAVVLAWRRSRAGSRRPDAERPSTGDDERDNSVWNAIPSWQYEGRHVESGGLTRGEQERALRDIQEQAEELSDGPSREP